MIVTDEAKVQRVWSRVMNTQHTQPQEAEKPGGITPEQVFALAQQELDNAATYRYLACHTNDCARAALQRLAEGEKCHARKLSAYYFLLTGKKLCTKKGKAACFACVSEALRQLYEKELAGSRRCRELAPLAGEHACTFQALSREESEHAQRIFRILQTTL